MKKIIGLENQVKADEEVKADVKISDILEMFEPKATDDDVTLRSKTECLKRVEGLFK